MSGREPGTSRAAASYNPLSMWVIYRHPKDDPEAFVARRWNFDGGVAHPTMIVMRDPTLEAVQLALRQRGLFRLDRHPSDDPVIVEVWL